MSFKRLEPEDFLISTDAIAAPAFAGGSSINTANSTANSGVSLSYYRAVKSNTDSRVEVTLAYGNITGSVSGSQAIYRQFANIIQGDSTSNLPVGATFNAVTLIRNKFKESISPRTFSIGGVGIDTASLTFTEAGRELKSTTGNYYLYPDIGTALVPTSTTVTSGIKGCSEETTTFTNSFIRINPGEFNYSTNPSFSDEDGYLQILLIILEHILLL